MKSDIKVSVCVVTYNQEKYIAECLQSLVDQKCDFGFEIIVGEDCSTDRTRDIVDEFAKRYPDLIIKNYHDNNIGAVKNVISTYKMAKARYICHVDGDDAALPDKLQKQFDVIEKHPDCVICSHDMFLINDDGERLPKTFRKHSVFKNTLVDLYSQLPFFAHSSKMFLNDLNEDYWGDLHEEALDIEIHVKQVEKGNIYHINEPLGVYRVFSGVSSTTSGINPLIVQGSERIFENAAESGILDREYVDYCYAKMMFEYAYQSALLGDKNNLVLFIRKSLEINKYSKLQVIFSFLSYCPSLVILVCKFRTKYL